MSSSIPMSLEPRRARADRSADRWVTVVAIAVAVAYLAAGLLATFLPADVRGGTWLPLHLALAGASLTAIGGVMPFFTAALAAATPAPRWLRVAVVALLACGIGLAAGGRTAGVAVLAVAGGVLVVVGLVGLLAAAFLPLRGSLATRRPGIWAAYAIAIVEVAIGVTLAVADLEGDPAIAAAWPLLKPAHAWLNLFGFVSLVIATTLVHFLPTIAGTRIVRRPALDVALLTLGAGPILAALGFVTVAPLLVGGGALLEVVGAIALVVGVAGIVRDRGRWTTDLGWHRFTLGSLIAGVAWFCAGTAAAAWPAVENGASADAWDVRLVLAPLVIGWTAQAIVGSAAHLLPSIGPGGREAHAAVRRSLGRFWLSRIAAFNGGIVLLWATTLGGPAPLAPVGIVLVALSVGAAVGLVTIGIAVGRAAPGAESASRHDDRGTSNRT
ncbi:MAG TPA: hypothetical protein VGK63_10475 [Candidatus Limnocylindrales bacterium]